MIARRLWVADKGERRVFCSEKCELRSERKPSDRAAGWPPSDDARI